MGTDTSNRLIINLMDGEMYDPEDTEQQYEAARQAGIVTFGVFLGSPNTKQTNHMNRYFGRNNWRPIATLADMPKVVGKRIVDIFESLTGDES
jgi:nitric oxide reductase activation protein